MVSDRIQNELTCSLARSRIKWIYGVAFDGWDFQVTLNFTDVVCMCVCVNVKTKVFIADSIMFIWRMIGIWMMTIIDDDNYVDDDNETAL